ncbi:GumC family protein (plasmid) [Aliirhizobium terrae]|uniref:GumC family protein n=1 Tax=Terrirhizobium terrae TaxID=2926709 RepID=UPI0025774F8B|nr:GumC family protein [Rhizobium sp. CC-CFT758]WJH37658.1 GumC family protein [Rhizobium sp. CC-CFT758]
MIGLIASTVVVLTAAYVFTVPPVYTAWTRIVIDPSVRKPFDDLNAPSLLGNEALAVDTQLLIISSAAVLGPVVTDQALAEDPEFNKASAAGPSEGTRAKAIENLAKALTVAREGATYVISIGVKSQNAAKSARLSSAIADSYVHEQQQSQLHHSEQLAEQIDGRLVDLRNRLRTAEEKVQQYRAAKRLQGSADGTLLAGQELSGLNAQLVEARSAFATATAANEEIQRYLRREIEPTSLSNVVNSPRMLQLLDEFARTSKQEASLGSSMLPQHPSIRRLQSELQRLSSLIRDELRAVSDNNKVELEVARQRVQNLERQMETVRLSSDSGEEELIELRELEAEARSTRAVYENVLGRAKELANLDQVTMPIARIISPAQPPENPSWPKKKALLGVAAAAGFALGIAIIVSWEVWSQLRSFLLRQEEIQGMGDEDMHPPQAAEAGPCLNQLSHAAPTIAVLPDDPGYGRERPASLLSYIKAG